MREDTIPPMTQARVQPLTLDNLDVRRNERTVAVDGVSVMLGARAFDLLEVLIEHRNRTVSKGELMDRVWPNVVVEENNLQVQISTLRKVLGAQAIATIPGRGYRLVLADAPSASASDSGVRPSTAPPPARQRPARAPTNLPAPSAALLGRDHELDAVRALVVSNPLVSIVGAGGMGKTRLAQNVAAAQDDAFPDGIWWVDLASLADPTLVATTAARVIGAPGGEGAGPLQALQALLESQQSLIVLDNCEHLADAVVVLAEALVAYAPHVRILVTSQEPLRSAREQLYRLGPLATPAQGEPMPVAFDGSVLLFIERARALDSRFVLDAARWPSVAEICRRLDGIPLAIEMAAARLPLLGIEGLRQRLDERFNILTGNSRTVLRRHQTLRATLDWSHSLLSPGEQIVLRRLGVFAGSFSLESAQRVASDAQLDPWAAIDDLGALVDKSLVMAEGGETPRYRLLETTRAYALERLGEAGETSALLRRHAEALRDLLAEIDRSGEPAGAADPHLLRGELDNLRAALSWARDQGDAGDLVAELASLSSPVWNATVSLHEGIEALLSVAPRLCAATPAAVQARFWKTLARLGTVSARRECFDAAARAADLYRQLGDVDNLYEVLIARAGVGAERGEIEAAAEALAEGARIEHDGLSRRLRGSMAWARQRWLICADRTEDAMQAVLLQAEHYRSEGFVTHAAIAEGCNLAFCEIALGRPRSAEARARHALTVLESHGVAHYGGHVRMCLALATSEQGRHEEAIEEARAALPLLMAEGDEFRLLEPLALTAALQGRAADAARVLGYADRHRGANGAVRNPDQQRRRDRIDAASAASMDADSAATLREIGAALSHAAAFSCAFGDVR